MWKNDRKNIGKQGSEEGIIISDLEHNDGARITIEKDGLTAPFSVTLGVYGELVHTDFFSTRSEAESYQQRAMREIEKLLVILSAENPDRGAEYQSIIKKITQWEI